MGDNGVEIKAGFLHDVVEDSDLTLDAPNRRVSEAKYTDFASVSPKFNDLPMQNLKFLIYLGENKRLIKWRI